MRTQGGKKRVKAVKNGEKRLFLRLFVYPSLPACCLLRTTSGFPGGELRADIPTLSDFTAHRPVFLTVHIKQQRF
jgi:hypothetical protein